MELKSHHAEMEWDQKNDQEYAYKIVVDLKIWFNAQEKTRKMQIVGNPNLKNWAPRKEQFASYLVLEDLKLQRFRAS